jgi:hypothetical protein
MMAEFARPVGAKDKSPRKKKRNTVANAIEVGVPVAAGLAVGGVARGEMINRQLPRLWAMNEFIKTPQGQRMYLQNKQAFQKTMRKIIGPSPTKVGIAAGIGTTAALAGGMALEKKLREKKRRSKLFR